MIAIVQAGEPTSLFIDSGLRPMRSVNLASAFIAKGFDSIVIAPNFSHQKKKYRFKLPIRYVSDDKGITYHLLWSPGYKKNHSFMRVIDHAIFGIATFMDLMWTHLTKRKIKAIFVGFPQVEAAFFSVMFGKIFKIPVVLDIKDDWPETFIYERKSKKIHYQILYHYYRNLTRYITGSIIAWVTITKGFKKLQIQRFPILDKKECLISFLTTPINLSVYKIDKSSGNIDKIIFAGAFSKDVYDLSPLLTNLTDLKNTVSIEFYGCSILAKQQIDNFGDVGFQVSYKNWISEEELTSVYRKARFAMVPVADRPDFNNSFPNKFIEAISNGLCPIVPNGTIMADFCRKYEIGLIYDRNYKNPFCSKDLKEAKNRMEDKNRVLSAVRFFSHTQNYDRLSKFVIEKCEIKNG